MDLDTYVWKNRLTYKEISEDTGINPVSLSYIRHRTRMPRMDSALRLQEYTKGEVSILEMIPVQKRKDLEDWLEKRKKHEQ